MQQGRQAGDHSSYQRKEDRREEDKAANLTAKVARGALRVYMCVSVNPSMLFSNSVSFSMSFLSSLCFKQNFLHNGKGSKLSIVYKKPSTVYIKHYYGSLMRTLVKHFIDHYP